MEVSVNGMPIVTSAITAEAQNHPAPDLETALLTATRALVVRELLLQRARELDLTPKPDHDDAGRVETAEEALIRQVVSADVVVPEADEDACKRYYENNKDRFTSSTLYQASHILFASAPDDEPARADARSRAEQALAVLTSRPSAFGKLARELSDCPSGRDGGSLGQVTPGDIVPEIETFLASLEQGQLCPVPVTSRYGIHVLRLEHRVEGKQLPFEAVHDRVAAYLEEAGWRRAIAQYVQVLAGRADIRGTDIASAASPLVQ